MLDELRWHVLALTQEREVQESLFPDLEPCVPEELASGFEQAMWDVQNGEDVLSADQKDKLLTLDNLLEAISGDQYLDYWFVGDGHGKFPEWDAIRAAAKDVARAFGWPIEAPPFTSIIYLDVNEKPSRRGWFSRLWRR